VITRLRDGDRTVCADATDIDSVESEKFNLIHFNATQVVVLLFLLVSFTVQHRYSFTSFFLCLRKMFLFRAEKSVEV